jgi:Lysyl oxidase
MEPAARRPCHGRPHRVVATRPVAFCPNSFNPARLSPDSPPTTPYPQQCGTNPFTLSMVWGVQKGWGTEPSAFFNGKLPVGVYHATEMISPRYARLLGVSARDAAATVKVVVVKDRRGHAAAHRARAAGPGRRPPAVPTLKDPQPAALPDLVALPAWNITVGHMKQGNADTLDFAASVWIGGNSQLDVEGFRSHGSPTMRAYQYFWRNGKVIGRAPAGTMGFAGYNHWHFQQFARYALLNSAKKLAVRSHKEGFCIAPVDAINLLIRHAVWNPGFTGLAGECGDPSAMWVAEQLPIGWADTYQQSVPGEAFNITHVPNGTYYIEVIANPEKLLYETTASNDISYRKVILGGTRGHRTVKVPAWHGIDPEP